jgi:hypothetical protein
MAKIFVKIKQKVERHFQRLKSFESVVISYIAKFQKTNHKIQIIPNSKFSNLKQNEDMRRVGLAH